MSVSCLVIIQWFTFHPWNKISIIFKMALHDQAPFCFSKRFLVKIFSLFPNWAGLPSVHQMCPTLSYLRAFAHVLPLVFTSQLKGHLSERPSLLISVTVLSVLPQSMSFCPLCASLYQTISSPRACSGTNYRRSLSWTLELVKKHKASEGGKFLPV